jgi:hypothetical protein
VKTAPYWINLEKYGRRIGEMKRFLCGFLGDGHFIIKKNEMGRLPLTPLMRQADALTNVESNAQFLFRPAKPAQCTTGGSFGDIHLAGVGQHRNAQFFVSPGETSTMHNWG